MFPLFLAIYGAVFVAEIAGDKLLYTTGILAARYRNAPILCGMGLAFMAKMGVAVMVGKAIATLPPLFVAGVTVLSFLGMAYALWQKPVCAPESKKRHPASKVAAISFAAIFFSEWGDVGQITAATFAARFGSPLIVWLGAVSAMITKGILAATVGAGLGQWIQKRIDPKISRVCGVTMLLVLGILSVLEILVERHDQ